MENKKVIDRRCVKLENVLKKDYIPYLSGRPERLTVINNEDLVNLRIALHSSDSLENFLEKV